MRSGCFSEQSRGAVLHRNSAPCRLLPLRRQLSRRARSALEEGVSVEDRGEASEQDKESAQKSGNEIYIGFDKSDSSPRTGRRGRVVKDNPGRYPEKDSLTGGWAGGEIGLRQFIEEEGLEGEKVEKAKVIESEGSGKDYKAKAVTSGGEEIYLGFSKEELEARKSGQRGRYITDDPRKYPDKESFGFFSGVTGGFAGGEKGVKQFVEKGEISLDDREKREFSPVLFAGLVAGGVTTGAILLNSGVLVSEQALTGTLQPGADGGVAPGGFQIDANTKTLLNTAFLLLGTGSAVIGARAVIRRLQKTTVRLKDDAINVGRFAVFWILVLIAALYIIDSQ